MRAGLQRVTGGAAVPYGFTILIAASGGMLIRTHGPPDLGDALLLVLGAALAFALAAGMADGEPQREPAVAATGLCSGAAAALGAIAADVVARGIESDVAFGLVGLAATFVYLAVDGLGIWLLTR